MKYFVSFIIGLCGLLSFGAVHASPLSLYELDQMTSYVECFNTCQLLFADDNSCVDGCSAVDPNWEKDGTPPVTSSDLSLAIYEYLDDGSSDYICTKEPTDGSSDYDLVLPQHLCEETGTCIDNHRPQECVDNDDDGVPLWLERLIDYMDDSNSDTTCITNADCNQVEQCFFRYELGFNVCLPRFCGDDGCTVFHLEQVAVNNQEVIVQVHYDYTAIPATVLDLRINYASDALTLVDTRPLPILTQAGKELHISHLNDTTLRVVVLSPLAISAIPFGPIVELVFARTSTSAAYISFALDDFSQQHALAPRQAEHTHELNNDELWGDEISIGAADPTGNRLLLHYSFDNPSQPLSYKDVPTSDTLCGKYQECTTLNTQLPIEALLHSKYIQQFDVLQEGRSSTHQAIDGVVGTGAYFNGTYNHVELPITFNNTDLRENGTYIDYVENEQNYSLSFWFYTEGFPDDASSDDMQLLFSHNNAKAGSEERTNYGLALSEIDDTLALHWFEEQFEMLGDPSFTTTSIAAIESHAWTHVGLTVNAQTSDVVVYVDGTSMLTTSVAGDVISCPYSSSGNIMINQVGDGGSPPQALYLGIAENNIYGIEHMDLLGIDRDDILRSGSVSYLQADYSPVIDKLVFVSNQSGDYEIWMSDRSGSPESMQQLTEGFGDTSLGIYARNPKWAPDASGIVFESNAYSKEQYDNLKAKAYHLYYIPFDAVTQTVSIDNGSLQKLIYDTADYFAIPNTDTGIVYHTYRLANLYPQDNHYNVRWLEGSHNDGLTDGVIVYTKANKYFEDKQVVRLSILNNIKESSPTPVAAAIFGTYDEVGLLDAYRSFSVDGSSSGMPVEQAKMLLKHSYYSYDGTSQFSISISPLDATSFAVVITHTSTGYDTNCWDKDNDQVLDVLSEDTNTDGQGTIADCYPSEIRNLFIEFPETDYSPLIAYSSIDADLSVNPYYKELALSAKYSTSASYVKVELTSPSNSYPLSDSQIVATIVMKRLDGSLEPTVQDFIALNRNSYDELYIQNMAASHGNEAQYFELAEQLDQVLAARFSPSQESLILHGIKDAQPLLLRTQTCNDAIGSYRISPEAFAIDGIDWTNEDRFAACNWIGAHRLGSTGTYLAGFHGGLDEFKMYSYIREPEAFSSESARGHERLEKEGRDDNLATLIPTCDIEGYDPTCPNYHLCQSGQCVMVSCNPNDPYSCSTGACTLRPASVGTIDSPTWVCSASCTIDSQCFSQQCLNGLCRFCDEATNTCKECQERTDTYGEFTVTSIEGCPDQNSFMCENGSCITECYSFESGESIYLCDPALEYCKQGRCELFDWEWADLSPMTLSGGHPMTYADIQYSTVSSELYPIVIQAYGTEDYLMSPEVLVEAKAANTAIYNGAWFSLGRFTVNNRFESQAETNTYTLLSPHMISDLRFRLVQPPFDNVNAGSTGLAEKERDFCLADAASWNLSHPEQAVDESVCYRRATGSRFMLNYSATISDREINYSLCSDGSSWCIADTNHDNGTRYLFSGQPVVIIKKVVVADIDAFPPQENIITENRICSYEGDAAMMKDGPYFEKIFFGNSFKEQSNQATYLAGLENASLHDGFPYGLEALSENITLNGKTVAPLMRYKGQDATTDAWPPWGYGGTFYPLETSSKLSVGHQTPLSNSTTKAVKGIDGKEFVSDFQGINNLTTEDIIIQGLLYNAGDLGVVFSNMSGNRGIGIIQNTDLMAIQIGDGTVKTIYVHSIEPSTWYFFECFLDREGIGRCYINGEYISLHDYDISSVGSIQSTGSNRLLLPNYDGWNGKIAFLAMYAAHDWFENEEPWTDTQELARKHFSQISGAVNDNRYPSTHSRDRHKYVARQAFSDGNLLEDGDMEAAHTYRWQESNYPIVDKRFTTNYNGNFSRILRVTNPTQNMTAVVQTPLVSNNQYQLTGWYRTDSVNTNCRILNSGGTFDESFSNTQWSYIDEIFTASTNAIYFYTTGIAAGAYCELDDLKIVHVNDNYPLFSYNNLLIDGDMEDADVSAYSGAESQTSKITENDNKYLRIDGDGTHSTYSTSQSILKTYHSYRILGKVRASDAIPKINCGYQYGWIGDNYNEWQSIDVIASSRNSTNLTLTCITSTGQCDFDDLAVYEIPQSVYYTQVGRHWLVHREDTISSATTSLQLLDEPYGRNLLLESEEFDQAVWIKDGASIDINATISPNGEKIAEGIICNTSSNPCYVEQRMYASGSATIHFTSIFVKPGTHKTVLIKNVDTSSQAVFHLDTMYTSDVVGATAAILQYFGNGWYRIGADSDLDTTTDVFQFHVANEDGTTNIIGDGSTPSMYFWGAMVESNDFPSSYISTVHIGDSRTPDVLEYPEPTANDILYASPSSESIEFDTTTNGFALLNCTLADPTLDQSQWPKLEISNIDTSNTWPGISGPLAEINDNANACYYDKNGTYIHCYEYMGDVTFDPYIAAPQSHGILDFSTMSSMGWDNQ